MSAPTSINSVALILATTLVSRTGVVTSVPACVMPDALKSEGYEAKGDKYYRLYGDSGAEAERDVYIGAERKCHSVGARLAMFKTEEEYKYVLDYRNTPGLDMFVGITNPDFFECWGQAECDGRFRWADGTVVNPQDYWGGVDADNTLFCFRMVSWGHAGDRFCNVRRPFTCQYDCQDVFTDTVEGLCPGSPSGYDYYFGGRSYRLMLDQPKNYADAQETCRSSGGFLPVFDSEEAYHGARIMALHSVGDPILLGLKATDATASCASAADCAAGAKLEYRRPGATADESDDVTRAFAADSWLDGAMAVSAAADAFGGATKLCTVMGREPDYEISSADCATAAPFACVYKCPLPSPCADQPPAETPGVVSSDWVGPAPAPQGTTVTCVGFVSLI